VDEELYRRLSMPYGEQAARYAAGIHQVGKTQKYYWSDGSFTWCASCGNCTASEANPGGRWVIHHAAEPLGDLLAQHLAEAHGVSTAEPPRVDGISFTVGVGYVRAACQQCGWEQDVHNETRWHPDLVTAAELHVSTDHLPSGGCCSSGRCNCGDNR
jgi:hypothetical protein